MSDGEAEHLLIRLLRMLLDDATVVLNTILELQQRRSLRELLRGLVITDVVGLRLNVARISHVLTLHVLLLFLNFSLHLLDLSLGMHLQKLHSIVLIIFGLLLL